MDIICRLLRKKEMGKKGKEVIYKVLVMGEVMVTRAFRAL